jgi:hypothetical protein
LRIFGVGIREENVKVRRCDGGIFDAFAIEDRDFNFIVEKIIMLLFYGVLFRLKMISRF